MERPPTDRLDKTLPSLPRVRHVDDGPIAGAGPLVQVLLVEADDADAWLLHRLLHPAGRPTFESNCVTSLDEALRELQQRRYDIVLLDSTLPDSNCLRALRAVADAAPNVPIVVLTHYEDTDIALRAMQAGAQDHLVKGSVGAKSLARAIRYAIERHRTQAELRRRAVTDGVTGLPNRAQFDAALPRAVARARRQGTELAVVFVDLDGFKHVNDELGHDAGDRVLVEVGRRLGAVLRGSDTVARIGGDEFGLLLDDLAQPHDAVGVAQKVLAAVSEPYRIGRHTARIGASLGVALQSVVGPNPTALLRAADAAMYRAKALGKGRVVQHRPGQPAVLATDGAGESLHRALDEGRFELNYQPICDLDSREVVAVEALIRWRRSEGAVPELPSRFLPLAEECGIMTRLTTWVLREACGFVVGLRRSGRPELGLCVNLSAADFEDPELVSRLEAALQHSGLPASALTLELSEPLVMRNIEASAQRLAVLSELGVKLALDDFGTGRSSLASLARLPIDTLKIDRSLIAGLPVARESRVLCKAIAGLARHLDMHVVAEGVETERQLRVLGSLRCDRVQGFLMGHPMSARTVGKLLDSQGRLAG